MSLRTAFFPAFQVYSPDTSFYLSHSKHIVTRTVGSQFITSLLVIDELCFAGTDITIVADSVLGAHSQSVVSPNRVVTHMTA